MTDNVIFLTYGAISAVVPLVTSLLVTLRWGFWSGVCAGVAVGAVITASALVVLP